MGYGRRAPIVRKICRLRNRIDVFREGARIGLKRPHGPHRHVGVAAHLEIVSHALPLVFDGLSVDFQSTLVRTPCDLTVVMLSQELREGAPEIPQEPVARGGILHDLAREDGHPTIQVVAAQPRKFARQVFRPVLRSDL